MKHSFVDRYAGLSSPLHVLDARSKILGFTAMILAVLFLPEGRTFAFFAFFFVTAIFMGISQVPLLYIVGRAVAVLPFVLLAGLARPWKTGFDLGGLGTLLVRALLCLFLLVLLTNTTRFTELLRGLRKLGFPRLLVLNLSFLYRYIFVLTDEAMRLRQARRCRAVGRSRPVAELKVLGSMIGTLLVRSFERAERMYQAMLSRGYSGAFPVYAPHPFTWRDLLFLAGLAGFIIAVYRW